MSLDKLAFVGGGSARNPSARVDLMDPSTGAVTHLPDMLHARAWPACVANEDELFVFSDWLFIMPGAFKSEVYEGASAR